MSTIKFNGIPTIKFSDLQRTFLDAVEASAGLPSGNVMFEGPRGCGKTTALVYAAVRHSI